MTSLLDAKFGSESEEDDEDYDARQGFGGDSSDGSSSSSSGKDSDEDGEEEEEEEVLTASLRGRDRRKAFAEDKKARDAGMGSADSSGVYTPGEKADISSGSKGDKRKVQGEAQGQEDGGEVQEEEEEEMKKKKKESKDFLACSGRLLQRKQGCMLLCE